MYERISAPLIPKQQFQSRVLRGTILGVVLIALSLVIGMVPTAPPEVPGAKILAGVYALYSGLMLLIVAGVVFAPVIHRFLHKMHLDEDAPSPRKAT